MNNPKDAFINDWNNEIEHYKKKLLKLRLEPVAALKLLSGDNGILHMKSVSISQLEALSLLGVTSMVQLGGALLIVPKRRR
jgi:hypothetical protein